MGSVNNGPKVEPQYNKPSIATPAGGTPPAGGTSPSGVTTPAGGTPPSGGSPPSGVTPTQDIKPKSVLVTTTPGGVTPSAGNGNPPSLKNGPNSDTFQPSNSLFLGANTPSGGRVLALAIPGGVTPAGGGTPSSLTPGNNVFSKSLFAVTPGGVTPGGVIPGGTPTMDPNQYAVQSFMGNFFSISKDGKSITASDIIKAEGSSTNPDVKASAIYLAAGNPQLLAELNNADGNADNGFTFNELNHYYDTHYGLGVTPGGVTPGGVTPGGVTPGGVTPGGVTPGGVTPGGITPKGVTPGGYGQVRAAEALDGLTSDQSVLNAVIRGGPSDEPAGITYQGVKQLSTVSLDDDVVWGDVPKDKRQGAQRAAQILMGQNNETAAAEAFNGALQAKGDKDSMTVEEAKAYIKDPSQVAPVPLPFQPYSTPGAAPASTEDFWNALSSLNEPGAIKMMDNLEWDQDHKQAKRDNDRFGLNGMNLLSQLSPDDARWGSLTKNMNIPQADRQRYIDAAKTALSNPALLNEVHGGDGVFEPDDMKNWLESKVPSNITVVPGVVLQTAGMNYQEVQNVKNDIVFMSQDVDGSKLIKKASEDGPITIAYEASFSGGLAGDYVNNHIRLSKGTIDSTGGKVLTGVGQAEGGIQTLAHEFVHAATDNGSNSDSQQEETLATVVGDRILGRFTGKPTNKEIEQQVYDGWMQWTTQADSYKNLSFDNHIFEDLAALGITFDINKKPPPS